MPANLFNLGTMFHATKTNYFGGTVLRGAETGGIMDDMRGVIDVDELKREAWTDADEYWEVYRWSHLRILACRHRLCTQYLNLT